MYFIFVLSYGKQSLDGVVYLYDPILFFIKWGGTEIEHVTVRQVLVSWF